MVYHLVSQNSDILIIWLDAEMYAGAKEVLRADAASDIKDNIGLDDRPSCGVSKLRCICKIHRFVASGLLFTWKRVHLVRMRMKLVSKIVVQLRILFF